MAASKKTTQKNSEPEYVGPYYVRGILMPDGNRIRPKHASAKERKEMIARYPRVANYFKIEKKES